MKILNLSADDPEGPALPTRSNEEFRPFIRRLPEFKFWYAITKSTTIAIVCTFFEVFNVPVFWPILVMYFITLFCITMKRQIRVSFFELFKKFSWFLPSQSLQHMIKHRYLPFTHNKPKYQTAEVTIK
jgi:Rer1 family